MSGQPLVSVIIPVWNCEKYVAAAIESVLGQTYRPLELILVDDGSTDGSPLILAGYAPPARVHHQPNAGLGAARNAGIGLAAGELIAFLDADDLWLPQKLEIQVRRMCAEPRVDMVFAHVEQFVTPDLSEDEKRRVEGDGAVITGTFAGTLLARRAVFDHAGLFATHWRVGEFIDWYLKARESGLLTSIVPEVVMKRRLHATNMTRRERDKRADYARIIKASLDRRRRGQGS